MYSPNSDSEGYERPTSLCLPLSVAALSHSCHAPQGTTKSCSVLSHLYAGSCATHCLFLCSLLCCSHSSTYTVVSSVLSVLPWWHLFSGYEIIPQQAPLTLVEHSMARHGIHCLCVEKIPLKIIDFFLALFVIWIGSNTRLLPSHTEVA